MDPNVCLTNLRGLVTAILDNADESTSELLLELCESFDSLDGWIRNGGFLPTDWSWRESTTTYPSFVDPTVLKP